MTSAARAAGPALFQTLVDAADTVSIRSCEPYPRVTEPLSVEVFLSEPDRWIAIIEAPAGPFSTQARSPIGIPAEVRRWITEVLGQDLPFMLLDDLGKPWSPAVAEQQLARLETDS